MKLHLLLLPFAFGAGALADELLIGSATIDITPDQPVALAGEIQHAQGFMADSNSALRCRSR
jgi:hypothetical protein